MDTVSSDIKSIGHYSESVRDCYPVCSIRPCLYYGPEEPLKDCSDCIMIHCLPTVRGLVVFEKCRFTLAGLPPETTIEMNVN